MDKRKNKLRVQLLASLMTAQQSNIGLGDWADNQMQVICGREAAMAFNILSKVSKFPEEAAESMTRELLLKLDYSAGQVNEAMDLVMGRTADKNEAIVKMAEDIGLKKAADSMPQEIKINQLKGRGIERVIKLDVTGVNDPAYMLKIDGANEFCIVRPAPPIYKQALPWFKKEKN